MGADYDTGLRALNEYSYAGRVTLDLDFGNACTLKLGLYVLSDFVIGYDSIAKILVGNEPSGIPVADYADSKTVGINLLSHC